MAHFSIKYIGCVLTTVPEKDGEGATSTMGNLLLFNPVKEILRKQSPEEVNVNSNI